MKRTPLNRGKGFENRGSSLRRTQGLQSRSRLESKSELKASTGLSRSSGLSAGDGESLKRGNGLNRSSFKKKPYVQSPEERQCRKIVKLRSGGDCEICGGEGIATDMAHRRARSQSGPWTASNMLHACRKCHSGNHDDPARAYEYGWHVKSTVDWKTQPVFLRSSRWVILDDKGGIQDAETAD